MKKLLSALSIFVLMALTGCEAVFTPQPLGDEGVILDPATWQGTWLSDEVVLLTTVMDGEKGQLQAAWVERGAAGAKFETVMGSVRRTGDLMFLSMEHDQTENAEAGGEAASEAMEGVQYVPEFFWARIENDGRRAILWWPDVEQFRLAVGDGRLPGVIKPDKDVILNQLEASHLALINSPSSNLLKWSEPVTFIRIGD